MARPAAAAALLALLLALCPAGNSNNGAPRLAWAQETSSADATQQPKCRFVPEIPALDTLPTLPDDYGRCTDAIEPQFLNTSKTPSNWCAAERFEPWPAGGPPPEAAECLKFGRLTVFSGPILGKTADHTGACGLPLIGSDSHALVAVSTKYLRTTAGAWPAPPPAGAAPGRADGAGACGRCMCVRVHGADLGYNPGADVGAVRDAVGATFAARVGDRCAECEDDHLDVLLDRPFSYAPYDSTRRDLADNATTNRHAPLANRLAGLRAFGAPSALRGGPRSPESVGVYVADWAWAPCAWTHADCGFMFEETGYRGRVAMPAATQGIDSDTLLPIARPLDDASYRFGHENLASPADGVVLGPGGPSESREAMLALVSSALLAPNGGAAAGALAEGDGITLLVDAGGAPPMEPASPLLTGGLAANGGAALRETSLLRNSRAALEGGRGGSGGGQQSPGGAASGGNDWASRSVGAVTAGALVGILVAAAVVLVVVAIIAAACVKKRRGNNNKAARAAAAAAAAGGLPVVSMAPLPANGAGIDPAKGWASKGAAAAAAAGDVEGGGGVVRGGSLRSISGSGATGASGVTPRRAGLRSGGGGGGFAL